MSERTTANLRRDELRKIGCSRAARRSTRRSAADDAPGRRARAETRISSADIPSARARAFIASTNAADASRLLDRERLRGIVRGAEEQPGQQVSDRDPLTGPEPERGARTVVAAIEDGVRDGPGRSGRAARLRLQDEERGHELGQAGDRPRLARRLLEEELPGAEVHQHRRRRLDRGTGMGSARGRQAGQERGRRPVRGNRRRRRRDRGAERPERRDLREQDQQRQDGGRAAAAVRLTRSAGGRAGSCGGEPA